jgi:2-dehydropantoate 2-reductase
VFTALLHESGHQVCIVSRRPDIVKTINTDGVTVLHRRNDSDGVLRAPVPAFGPGEVIATGPYDVVMLVNKSMDSEFAVDLGAQLSGDDGIVVALQNGLRSAEIVEGIPSGVAGVTYQGATYNHDATVSWTHVGRTLVAARPAIADRTARWVATLSTPSLPWEVASDRDAMLWEKLIAAISNSLSGALLQPVFALMRSESAQQILQRARSEAFDIAASLGVQLDRTRLETAFASGYPSGADTSGSTFQSLMSGRPTEVGDISGSIADAAAGMGLPAPYNTALALLVHAREQLEH